MAKEVAKCIRCGFCVGVCPPYAADRLEIYSARGRINLIRGLVEGALTVTPRLIESLFTCTTCQRCDAECPAGIRIADMIAFGKWYALQRARMSGRGG